MFFLFKISTFKKHILFFFHKRKKYKFSLQIRNIYKIFLSWFEYPALTDLNQPDNNILFIVVKSMLGYSNPYDRMDASIWWWS